MQMSFIESSDYLKKIEIFFSNFIRADIMVDKQKSFFYFNDCVIGLCKIYIFYFFLIELDKTTY